MGMNNGALLPTPVTLTLSHAHPLSVDHAVSRNRCIAPPLLRVNCRWREGVGVRELKERERERQSVSQVDRSASLPSCLLMPNAVTRSIRPSLALRLLLVITLSHCHCNLCGNKCSCTFASLSPEALEKIPGQPWQTVWSDWSAAAAVEPRDPSRGP